jgi:hypothetical protein
MDSPLGVGGGPPNDLGVTLLRGGEWFPPSASDAALQKAIAAEQADQGKPAFDGEVNGFRLYDFDGASKDVEYPNIWCNASDYKTVEAFRLDYVPPGTYANGSQQQATCVDGTPAFATQQFSSSLASWSVTYYPVLAKAIPSIVASERVSAGTVHGRPAVVIRPIISEGNGTSFVAFDFGKGWAVISATEMPLDETLKVAEGLECIAC